MLKTFDVILIITMTAAATVTYSIKHRAELKLEEVRRLEAEIKLEKDTIDLLKADWALLTQPNRLERLMKIYGNELQLVPTEPTQLAQPVELPMLKADVPAVVVAQAKDTKSKGGKTPASGAAVKANAADSVDDAEETDHISTGSVED